MIHIKTIITALAITLLTLPLYLWTQLCFAFNDSGETSFSLISLLGVCFFSLAPVLMALAYSYIRLRKKAKLNMPLYTGLIALLPLCLCFVIFYEFSTLPPILSLRNAVLEYRVEKIMGNHPQFLDSHQNTYEDWRGDATGISEYYRAEGRLLIKTMVGEGYVVYDYPEIEESLLYEILNYNNRKQKELYATKYTPENHKDLYTKAYYISDSITIVDFYSYDTDKINGQFVQVGESYYLTKLTLSLYQTPYSDYTVYSSSLRTKDFMWGYSPDFQNSPSFSIIEGNYFSHFQTDFIPLAPEKGA